MQSQEKLKQLDLAQRFPPQSLARYVANSDPNETAPRNTLEISLYKLNDTAMPDEVVMLNGALRTLIERGLDIDRQVELLRFSGEEFEAPNVLQCTSNILNVDPGLITTLIEQTTDLSKSPNSGYNTLLGCIRREDYVNFEKLYNEGMRFSQQDGEYALKTLTLTCSASDAPELKASKMDAGMKILEMGVNLYNIRVFNDIPFENELTNRGQAKLAALVESLKIESSINQQKTDAAPEDIDTIIESTYQRGL